MGKQNRIIAQKTKVKQQQHVKKPKAVKTNLKRLNEHVRNKVEKVDKLYDNKAAPSNKQEKSIAAKQQDDQSTTAPTKVK